MTNRLRAPHRPPVAEPTASWGGVDVEGPDAVRVGRVVDDATDRGVDNVIAGVSQVERFTIR